MTNETAHQTTPATEIRQFLFKQFPLARKRGLEDTDPLLVGGVLDSLGILDLVAFLEERFAIQVSDEDLVPENFQSIGCVAEFVRSKSNGVS